MNGNRKYPNRVRIEATNDEDQSSPYGACACLLVLLFQVLFFACLIGVGIAWWVMR